jgi:hypothetical protein
MWGPYRTTTRGTIANLGEIFETLNEKTHRLRPLADLWVTWASLWSLKMVLQWKGVV